MRHRHAVIHYRALDFWLARGAVLVIISPAGGAERKRPAIPGGMAGRCVRRG
jgi:hypothetical protein